MDCIPESEDSEQAKTLPFAVRYLKCPPGSKEICDDNENRFRSICWMDRDDVTPPTQQRDKPASQVEWHPGFRVHQLIGRTMAMIILDTLKEAINTWSEVTIIGM